MVDTTVEYLKSQLAEALLLQRKAEEDGAELAMLYEAKIAALSVRIAELERGDYVDDDAAYPGEVLSLVLAVILALTISFIEGVFNFWARSKFGTVAFASGPLLYAISYWQWVRVKRKQHWVSWGDNDIYRVLFK